MRRGRGACGCLAREATGWPGTKTGASPAKEPSADAGVEIVEVSCPPNALCPLTIGGAPPLLPPLPNPPRLPRPPLFGFEGCVGIADSGATEAGRRAREAFTAGGAGVCPEAPPRLPPRPRRWRGGRLRPTGGGGSTVDIVCNSTVV